MVKVNVEVETNTKVRVTVEAEAGEALEAIVAAAVKAALENK